MSMSFPVMVVDVFLCIIMHYYTPCWNGVLSKHIADARHIIYIIIYIYVLDLFEDMGWP
jgi:hypothetical protein